MHCILCKSYFFRKILILYRNCKRFIVYFLLSENFKIQRGMQGEEEDESDNE